MVIWWPQKVFGTFAIPKFHKKKKYVLTISLPRFWFFAAWKNLDTTPLALQFNGGVCSFHNKIFLNHVWYLSQPGSSSMIGLFQEHGPCQITNDSSSITPNLYSWNNEANVLYIDQPVGVGFSQGDLKVGTVEVDVRMNRMTVRRRIVCVWLHDKGTYL